jgi:hypothetical protein
VFRKPSTESLRRSGRIADRTTATNVFDGSATHLEVERRETYDMLEIAGLKDALAQAQTSRNAEVSALRARIDQLSAAQQTAEEALREIRASTSWRATAPIRLVSELVRRR